MTKRTFWVTSVLAVAFLLIPTVLSAETVNQKGTSTAMIGENQVTWDSNFVHHGYVLGESVTMRIDWSGTARMAGMVSVGMARPFSPDGAAGTIIGVQRLGTEAALVTMAFTRLHKSGRGGVATAFLHINLAVDDGSGRIVIRPFPVKCHVKAGK